MRKADKEEGLLPAGHREVGVEWASPRNIWEVESALKMWWWLMGNGD